MSGITNGESGNSLIRELLQKPQRYEYYMAIKLLQGYWGRNVKIRTFPNLTLAFNANDIDHITIYDLSDPVVSYDGKTHYYTEITVDDLFSRFDNDDSPQIQFCLYVNFLGLFGSSTPLPVYYTEELIGDYVDDNYSTTDFIAAINEPIYRIYDQAKNKYRIFQQLVEHHPINLIERLFAFVGGSIESIRNNFNDPFDLLPYLGIFSMFPRSKEGLATILRSELVNCDIVIDEFVSSIQDVPECQIMQLGITNSVLGEVCYLGNKIKCIDGTIRVNVQCKNENDFISLMPDGLMYKKISGIFKVYFIDRVNVIFHVVMKNLGKTEIPIGSDKHKLGINSFLGGLDLEQNMEFEQPLIY